MTEKLRSSRFFEKGRLPLCVFRMPFLSLSRNSHSHDFCEVMIVVAGMAIHHLNGKDEVISMGDVFVIQPDQVHGYDVLKDGGIQVVNVLFDPDLLVRDLRDLEAVPGFRSMFSPNSPVRRDPHVKLPADELAYVNAIVEQIEIEQEGLVPGCDFLCEAKFRELVVYLARRHSHVQGRLDKNAMNLSGVISYFERNLGVEVSFEEVVEISGMSATSLRRAFQQAFGCSPMAYLQKLRVQKAMRLLTDPTRSVTEIALEVGFGDSGYFSRVFKAECGMTPREFRRDR